MPMTPCYNLNPKPKPYTECACSYVHDPFSTQGSLSATGAPIFGREEKCPVPYVELEMRQVPGPGEYQPGGCWGHGVAKILIRVLERG